MAAKSREVLTQQSARPVLERARRGCGRSMTEMIMLAVLFLSASAAPAAELVSVNNSVFHTSGNNDSSGVAVNANGDFVTFWSDATDLVSRDTNQPQDTNQVRDVFVRDRTAATTTRADLNDLNQQTNLPSQDPGGAPAISADGRTIAFYSSATKLVDNDTNGQADVFVRVYASDGTGTTTRVSVSSDGTQGNGPSLHPSISGDGLRVAFESDASNLVPGDTNNVTDIFVHDRTDGSTVRPCESSLSIANGASSSPAISADGKVVAFQSAASNLVLNDTNNALDVFVCVLGSTAPPVRVSVNDAGDQGNGDSILPAISEDGRFVAFKSSATNLVPNDTNGVVDVFVRDTCKSDGVAVPDCEPMTQRVSVNVHGGNADEPSFPPSISYDGRFVAFGSAATNLVPNDFNGFANVFVRDIQNTHLTLMVDVNDQGQQANAPTEDVPPGISGDGKQVGFVSLATNLDPVDNDNNGQVDVYISRNPFSCDAQHPCPTGLICNNDTGFCEEPPPPTPTSTPPPECCQCEGSCAEAEMGMCAAGCTLVSSAVCIGENCATITPTVTPTPTLPACCQCEGSCSDAEMGMCPANCTLVSSAVCLPPDCATITPTVTPTPTLPACCQCEGSCSDAEMGMCPANCTLVPSAVCLPPDCATITPTVTPTPTLPACCQCEGSCADAEMGMCPANCTLVSSAVCIGENCATITPTSGTPTSTPTATNTTANTPTSTVTSTPPNTATNTPVNTPINTATGTSTRTPALRPAQDSDSCNCTVSAPQSGGRRVLLWLAGPLALLLLRRRSRN